MKKNLIQLAFAVTVLAVLEGCGGGGASDSDAPSTKKLGGGTPVASTPAAGAAITAFKPNVNAGIPISASTDPKKLANLIVMKTPGVRSDPFALLPSERAYDKSQLAESLLQNTGFTFMYEEPPEVDTTPVVEPQPYRRLAGVLVGDSIMALIDMGDGRLQLIHPGMQIPNTEWVVVSIDSDKAVLRRKGNKLPHEIAVRLGPPLPAGMGGSGGSGGGGGTSGGGGGGDLGG